MYQNGIEPTSLKNITEGMNLELELVNKWLNQPDSVDNIPKLRNTVKKVLQLALKGADVVSLAGQIIKLLASHDLVLKRLACLYIVGYCQKADEVNYLIANTLLQDSRDPNPMVRQLAMKTISYIPALREQGMNMIPTALEDPSAYVRRAAVFSCVRFNGNKMIASDEDDDYVDQLYAMIRDDDPVVVVNSLLAVNEILKSEGGVVISRRMCQYLVNLLSNLTEWGQVYVLKLLTKYRPGTEEESMTYINSIDVLFESKNSAVVVAAVDIFVHFLSENMSELKNELIRRIRDRMLSFLSSSKPERTFLVLTKISELVGEDPSVFSNNYKSFYCGFNEEPYLKVQKIKFLSSLANQSNWEDIVEELEYYSLNVDNSVSESAIKGLGRIVKSVGISFERCVKHFLSLLDIEDECLTSVVLSVILTLPLDDHRDFKDQLLRRILELKSTFSSSRCISPFLCIVGRYGNEIPDAPYVLEEFVDFIATNSDVSIKLSLMTSSLKIYCNRPAEMQYCLGRVLSLFVSDNCPEVSFRAKYYHSLLKCDKSIIRHVIFSQ